MLHFRCVCRSICCWWQTTKEVLKNLFSGLIYIFCCSAWIASFKNDPAKKGDNDVLVFATGTAGPWGLNAPPYVFVAHAKGSVDMDLLSDASNLFNRKVQVDEAGALLYVHWGLGEYCDIDGTPGTLFFFGFDFVDFHFLSCKGFGGNWPPDFAGLVSTYFNVILSKDKFANDTFLTAADWTGAKFQNLETGEDDGKNKYAEIKTENGASGKPLYTMNCHSNNATVTTKGLKIGEFRFKCDFHIRPNGSWVDQQPKANDPNPLLGGLSTIDSLGTNKGCTPAKRKIALLAFVAGASVKDDANMMTDQKDWRAVPVGDAELAFVTTVNIIDIDGKDTGRTAAGFLFVLFLCMFLLIGNIKISECTSEAVGLDYRYVKVSCVLEDDESDLIHVRSKSR